MPLYEGATFKRTVDQIAKNVRILRAARGWTQEAAAEACDISTRLLQAVEGGSWNATLVTLCRIADGLGVGAHELLAPSSAGPPRRRRERTRRRRPHGRQPG